jgi:hypothetical protein
MRVGTTGRTTLCAILLLAVTIPPAHPQQSDPGAGSTVDFEALLDRLADRAAQYRRFALGFTCEESLVQTFYKAERGAFSRRERKVYDYLFAKSEKSGDLEEIRELIEENGKQVRRSQRDLNLKIPPAYAWSQIFASENRGRFFFRYAGRLLSGYRLLIQIDFAGAAATPGGTDIAGWSGRASIDSETLNIHTIEAEPSGQAARIEAEVMKYQRAFAIMGVPLASRPRSRTLTVQFGFAHQGLTYPAVASLLKSVYVSTAEQGLEEKIDFRYRSYRFFVTGTKVEEPRDAPLPDAGGGEEDPNEPSPGRR